MTSSAVDVGSIVTVTGTPGISMSQHPVVLGQHCVPPAEQVQGVQGPDQDSVHHDQQPRALAYLQSALTMGQMGSPVMITSTSLHQETLSTLEESRYMTV